MGRNEDKIKAKYSQEIANIREEHEFSGGTIFSRNVTDEDGNKYGEYAYLVSPPSDGRTWHSLGKIEMDTDMQMETGLYIHRNNI